MEVDKTKQAVDLFDKYAHGYQSKYMSVEKYKSSLDTFCSNLPNSNASILELACGPGNITKYLLDKNQKLKILGTDLSPLMLELAEENNPTASFQLLDCRSILDLNSKFDAILCGFGLPYISKADSIQLIKDSYSVLNKSGLIYLSTMEDDYSKSGMQFSSSNPNDGLYQYFHEATYLLDAMENTGFQVLEVSRVKYMDDKNKEIIDLILIAKKTPSSKS